MSSADDDLRARVEEFISTHDHTQMDQVEFRGAQYDAGLAWVHFPIGTGGLGRRRADQAIVDAALREAGVPYHDLAINPIGIGMGAPTVLAYGDAEMHMKYLRPIFTGEDVWCQLFSEPTNGSDVAGIPSRGTRDGDEWIVNGQKVWTSLGHLARYGMLLTRTNPDVPKHRGLSYFVLDMHSPGISIRPLYQITGEAEFNEVFLDDVRVPDANRLGAEGDGWRVATTTLMNERVAIAGGDAGRGSGPIELLLRQWEATRDRMHPVERRLRRDQVAGLWIRAEVHWLTQQRARAAAVGGTPGPEGSVGKLAMAELHHALHEGALALQGPDGMLHEPGYPMTRSERDRGERPLSWRFLRSRAATIEGGTSEIMRNILGERVLGLPEDVRVDKGVPWSAIPK